MTSVEALNALGFEEFVEVVGNVIEHCPVIAAGVWSRRPFPDVDNLHQKLCQAVDSLSLHLQEGVLRCHPDLAGRLAAAGNLTSESTAEQKAAGLETMTSEERRYLSDANAGYKVKFGFPFVICARQNKTDAILKGIRKRLDNSVEDEIKTGIEEVKKICYLRLCNLIQIKSQT